MGVAGTRGGQPLPAYCSNAGDSGQPGTHPVQLEGKHSIGLGIRFQKASGVERAATAMPHEAVSIGRHDECTV